MSWRRVRVLIRQLPAGANTPTDMRAAPEWSVEAHLLDDVRMLLMASLGAKSKHIKPHPQRPVAVKPVDPERVKQFARQAERIRERKRRRARDAAEEGS